MFWSSGEEAGRWEREAVSRASVAVGGRTEAVPLVGDRSPGDTAKALLDLGVDVAVVKLGHEGVLAATRAEQVVVAPVHVEVLNGRGAGDALMSIWRNFFLGAEPMRRFGPIRRFDSRSARHTVREQLQEMGIDIRDPDQAVGTLSGGERQSVAIARAVYFGARVLILDEPTSALGVKQAGVVLRYIVQARDRGVAVVFITHNPHHAYPVGDRFVILNRGRTLGTYAKGELDRQELVRLMAGGRELAELEHELEAIRTEVS